MTVDEATIHAAILAVNEALEKEDSAETFAALSNPNTCLKKLEEANAERYQALLLQGKREKAAKSGAQVSSSMVWNIWSIEDVVSIEEVWFLLKRCGLYMRMCAKCENVWLGTLG